mgnify:CR=1 FL=1
MARADAKKDEVEKDGRSQERAKRLALERASSKAVQSLKGGMTILSPEEQVQWAEKLIPRAKVPLVHKSEDEGKQGWKGARGRKRPAKEARRAKTKALWPVFVLPLSVDRAPAARGPNTFGNCSAVGKLSARA